MSKLKMHWQSGAHDKICIPKGVATLHNRTRKWTGVRMDTIVDGSEGKFAFGGSE